MPDRLAGYADVLRSATEALDRQGLAHLVFGSIATRELGRRHEVHSDEDIDLFVRPPDAPAAMAALEAAGFVGHAHDAAWISKAKRGGVTVDVIFKAAGRMYVDEEMLARAVRATPFGFEVRLIPAEDLVVIKALLHDEDRAFDWFDALALLSRTDLDWEYLLRRAAAFGALRVLSLLIFAETNGIQVPPEVIRDLRGSAVLSA
jgi:predicted nucleotidyltransferase